MIRVLLGLLIGLLCLGGCGSVVGGNDPNAALTGKSWRLVSIRGAPVTANSQPTTQFGADGRLAGDASVNRYSGRYTLDGAKLTISQLTATKIAGSAAAMQQETSFLTVLGTSRSYQLTGMTLTIACDTGTLVFQE